MCKQNEEDVVAKALGEAQKMITQGRIKAMSEQIQSGSVGKAKYVERQLLRGKVKTWERYLAADVAEVNGCGVFYAPETGLLEAYGRPDDLDTVEKMFRFVYSQVADMTNKFSRTGQSDRKALAAFRLGVVDAIGEELERSHKNAASALKDVDPKVVDEAVKRLSGVLEDVLQWGESIAEDEEKHKEPLHPSFEEGRKAGKDVNIDFEKGDS